VPIEGSRTLRPYLLAVHVSSCWLLGKMGRSRYAIFTSTTNIPCRVSEYIYIYIYIYTILFLYAVVPSRWSNCNYVTHSYSRVSSTPWSSASNLYINFLPHLISFSEKMLSIERTHQEPCFADPWLAQHFLELLRILLSVTLPFPVLTSSVSCLQYLSKSPSKLKDGKISSCRLPSM